MQAYRLNYQFNESEAVTFVQKIFKQMKSMYFVRHAKSSWTNPSLDDIDRPLNERGLRDAPFMAQLLGGKGLKADRIISSPANRALTTASYFADALGIDRSEIEVNPRIYEAWSEDVLELVRRLPNSLNVVCIFGHNPTFTSIANMFSDSYLPNLPTCGVFRLDSEITAWDQLSDANTRLVELIYPKQYFS